MKRCIANTLALFGLLIAASSSTARADIIASFQFESGTASSDTEPLTISSGFESQATGAVGHGLLQTIPGATSNGTTWTAVAERDGTDTFFEFTVDLAAGTTEVSFDSLTFDAYVADTLANVTAFDYNLYWSVDGFASTIATGVGPSVSGGGSQDATNSQNFDLSGLAAQTSGVTFRLDPIFAAGSSTNGSGLQRVGALDNIILNGTATASAAVPEPSSLSLLLVGGLGLVSRRRRRRETVKAH